MDPQTKASGKTSTQASMPELITELFLCGSMYTGRKNSAITMCANASQSVPYSMMSGVASIAAATSRNQPAVLDCPWNAAYLSKEEAVLNGNAVRPLITSSETKSTSFLRSFVIVTDL